MKKPNKALLLIVIVALASINQSFAVDLKGSLFSHDPATLIKDGDNYWHFFTAPGVGAAYSKDMVNWTSSNNHIFQPGSNWKSNYPAWTIPYFGSGETANTDGNLWAPDIIYMNGAYYLYYSCSSFGSSYSAIGCVKSTSLNNPNWEDMGKVVSSNSRSDINAIDPGMFKDDDGKVYMVYGSFSGGIGIVEIDTITGLATTQVKHLAGGGSSSYEAPALFKEDGYYYLVINRGACCRGLESTYYIIVGRSTNVNGPYTDYRTLLPNKDGKYIGPGHFSLYRDSCANYVTTHFYNGERNGFAQYDILRMKMLDGWPVLSRNFSFDNCDVVLPPSVLINVSLIAPAKNAVYELDQSINLEAEASHAEGEIVKVAFWVNEEPVGEDFTAPYSYEISELEAGVYSIYAVATGDDGLENKSETTLIQVGSMVTIQENADGYCGITNDEGSIDTNHLNYTGTGFINTDNKSGVTINWSVNFTETGSYSILFRYASSSDRPGKVIINEDNIGVVDFPATASWDDWSLAAINYTVTNPGIVTISVSATKNEGLGNIDYMRIIPLETTVVPVGAKCPDDNSTSLFLYNSDEKMVIYPVPVKELLYVSTPENMSEIGIHTTNGKLVKSLSITENNHVEVPCSDLKSGLYIIKLSTNVKTYIGKFEIID
ncbi:MAG: family 43 glycosylhydrolase [Marinilabiliaceae bacterium]|nr:family 43 glycosylhydrolase [Marinilabiliaceae bacterium]